MRRILVAESAIGDAVVIEVTDDGGGLQEAERQFAITRGVRLDDAPSFAPTILGMAQSIGLPKTVLADTGFASGPAVAALEAQKIEPLVAIGRTQPHRPYDFRPPPDPKPPRQLHEPWRLAMQQKLETPDAKARYARRKQTVEPVFGIIKSALGFTRFHLRGLAKVSAEWTLIALAYNCRRLHRLRLA